VTTLNSYGINAKKFGKIIAIIYTSVITGFRIYYKAAKMYHYECRKILVGWFLFSSYSW